MLNEIGYYDGIFAPPEQLKISIEDRGFLFGEGVYEMVLAYNGVLWGMEDHLDRLERSLALMEMEMPMSRRQILDVTEQALAQVEGPAIGVYFQITRGTAPRSHSYNHIKGTKMMLIARVFDEHTEKMKSGYTAITMPDLRWGHCDIKTVNLIPNTMAASQAERAGVDMAIFVRDNMITEGASYNIYMVKNNEVYTAPLSNGLLPGVTRKHLTQLLPEIGLKLNEESFSLEQMYGADEVFASSTSTHPAPIVRIDGKTVGKGKVGPVSKSIYAAYEKMIEEKCGKRF